MLQDIKILNAKLIIPRSSETVLRDRLIPIIKEIGKKRITTVTAGAGFGKTTLVAQACHTLKMNTIWYRLDGTDKDFITFLCYLIAGFKKYFPMFGRETVLRIKSAHLLNREREAVLTVFLSEMEKLAENDLIIVLDDYHLVQNSREINEAVTFLVERFPHRIRLLIIRRT